jgi:hypothetical protein
MGHLFFVNDSFELFDVPEHKRDELLINFCKALNLARANKDSFWGTEEIYSRNYSFGTLFYGFLMRSISEINEVESLRGLSDVSLSLFHSLAYAVPGLIEITESRDKFLALNQSKNYGHCGFDFYQKPVPYVGCDECWHLWKIAWYTLNQNEILWTENIDENSFLPNLKYSEKILLREIKKKEKEQSKKENKIIAFDNSNVALSFHDNVMRTQGPNLAAYTIEIGGKIANANYYQYDEVLSKNESLEAKSARNIYKLLGKDGRLQYISLDHSHGMFEFHNYNGAHIGEYKFDGSYNSGADLTHNLKTLA